MEKELSKLLKEFKVKSTDDLLSAKTSDKQTRALVTGKPNLVSLTVDQCKRYCKSAGIEYKDGYETRVLQYVTTNESVDRYGDIVRAKGVDFKSTYYPDNPVVMYSHQYQMMPVGNTIKIWHDAQNKSIPAWALFMDNDTDTTGFADLVYRVAKSGFMRACSIGFIPLEYNNPQKKNEREKLGLGQYGVEFLKSEYLEFSPCGIPANPQALSNCFDETVIKEDFDTETIDRIAQVKLFGDDMNLLDMFAEKIKSSSNKLYFTIDGDETTTSNDSECCAIDDDIKPCDEDKGISSEPAAKSLDEKMDDLLKEINMLRDTVESYLRNKSDPAPENPDASEPDEDDGEDDMYSKVFLKKLDLNL